jgi:CheY-like chemotaxis protein
MAAVERGGQWRMDPATPHLRILVVDDNADAADSLAMLLQLAEHETVTAYSGPEAIEAARREKPNAVFLDIGLPGMSGYDVARAMRADPALAGVALVALTGWGSDNDQQRATEAGFDYHLTKPAGIEQVYEVLGQLAAARTPRAVPAA